MAQVSNVRLLLPSLYPFSKPTVRFSFRSLFTVLASSSRRHRNVPRHPLHLDRINRTSTSTRESRKDTPMEVEETNSVGVGFNKRRAEGRDKSDAPKKNLHLKVRKLNPINTISYVQILGTGMDTQDTSSSVLLFFDKQRFIFNAGEGLQRFCTEHKVKLSKLTSLYGGPLEFLLVVEGTEDPAYHPVSRLMSKFEGSLDARIVVASLTTTCSKKIHNQLVGVEANMYCFWMMMLGYILDQLERSLVRWKRILRSWLL